MAGFASKARHLFKITGGLFPKRLRAFKTGSFFGLLKVPGAGKLCFLGVGLVSGAFRAWP